MLDSSLAGTLEGSQSLFEIFKATLAYIGCANLSTSKNFRIFSHFFFLLAPRITFAVNSALHFTISSTEQAS